MDKPFGPYESDQLFLLPPAMQGWVRQDHPVCVLSDIVDALDLSAITGVSEGETRGYPPHRPRMMIKLLLWAYALGVASSRRLAQRCEEDVAFRVLTANNTPDFRTISDFRKRHLDALAALFLQVLRCPQQAGLLKLETIALEGTKLKANASKHKAMNYGRMQTEVQRLEAGVKALLAQAERTDAPGDAQHGDRHGDDLPAELARRETPLATIRAPMAAPEAQTAAPLAEPTRPPRRGRPPKTPPGPPAPTAQRNFSDPDSRVMQDVDQAFGQPYNAQVAVEESLQIIVAQACTNQAADAPHAVPLLQAVQANTRDRPRQVLADAGYWSEANARRLTTRRCAPFLATAKLWHGPPPPPPRGRTPHGWSPRARRRGKLQTKRGHAIYARRKGIVEPVFGLIKRARGFRQFLLRGLAKVQAEWALICTGHNLVKLIRSGAWAAA